LTSTVEIEFEKKTRLGIPFTADQQYFELTKTDGGDYMGFHFSFVVIVQDDF